MHLWFSAGLGWGELAVSLLLLALAVVGFALGSRPRRPRLPPPPLDAVRLQADQEPTDRLPVELPLAPPPLEPPASAEPPPPARPPQGRVQPSAHRELSPCAPLPAIELRRSTRHPLVLVHGVMGFDRMRLAGIRVDYFRGVTDALRRNGFEVHVVRVDPLAPIPVRAAQLAEQVMSLGAGRVNLVAHSMGGLDARYALAHLGLEAFVASLTTIGTPHRGTPVADHGTRWLGDVLGLRRVAERLGAEVEGFWELTTQRMERFNAEVPDVHGVWYASVVSEGRTANPILRMTRSLLHREHGASDGLVPTDSQRWGTVVDHVEADHWAQIGWGVGFDAPQLYVKLGRVLGERGL